MPHIINKGRGNKGRGHTRELNEMAKDHFTPPRDVARVAQNARHLPRASAC